MATIAKVVTVKLDDVAPESTEVIAAAIVRISRGVEKLSADGLNRRALLTLLKDATSMDKYQIDKVLNALPQLEALYTIKKSKSGK